MKNFWTKENIRIILWFSFSIGMITTLSFFYLEADYPGFYNPPNFISKFFSVLAPFFFGSLLVFPIMNKMSKKIVLWGGFLGSVSFFLFWYLHEKGVCKTVDIYSSNTWCAFATVLSMIFLVILFFSAILFFIKKELVFIAWKKFTIIYLFIYLFIVIITPWYAGDGFFSIQKDLIALFISVIYLIISLLLIIYKSLKKE